MKPQLPYNNSSSITSASSPDAELLKLLLEYSRELLIVLDADMKILAYNSKAAEMALIILQQKLAPGKNAEEVVLKERRPFLKQLQLKLRAGETIEYSFTSPQKGQPVVYQVKFTPIFDTGDQLSKIIFSGLDISKETKAMQEIIASKSLLQQAESVARIGSWEWDIKSDRILWSDEFCRICGIEPG
ncbi:MAG: PAS domain-containing protein, partial [Ferruginibacter sp.]